MNIILEFPLLHGSVHYVDFTMMVEFLEFVEIDPIEFIMYYLCNFVADPNSTLDYPAIERWVMGEIEEYFDMYIHSWEHKYRDANTNTVLNFMRCLLVGDIPELTRFNDLDEVFNSITTVLLYTYSNICLPKLHRNHLVILNVSRLNDNHVVITVGPVLNEAIVKLYDMKGVRNGSNLPIPQSGISGIGWL